MGGWKYERFPSLSHMSLVDCWWRRIDESSVWSMDFVSLDHAGDCEKTNDHNDNNDNEHIFIFIFIFILIMILILISI